MDQPLVVSVGVQFDQVVVRQYHSTGVFETYRPNTRSIDQKEISPKPDQVKDRILSSLGFLQFVITEFLVDSANLVLDEFPIRRNHPSVNNTIVQPEIGSFRLRARTHRLEEPFLKTTDIFRHHPTLDERDHCCFLLCVFLPVCHVGQDRKTDVVVHLYSVREYHFWFLFQGLCLQFVLDLDVSLPDLDLCWAGCPVEVHHHHRLNWRCVEPNTLPCPDLLVLHV